jgi:transposase InsO family protein
MVMFDYEPDQIIIFDQQCHRFVAKIPGGPYVFWNGDRNKTERYGTVDILRFIAQKKYYAPGKGAAPAFRVTKSPDEELDCQRLAYLAFREKPRKRAEAKWLYVVEFLARILDRDRRGLPYAQNHSNAKAVVEAVDAQIDRQNGEQDDQRKWVTKPKCRAPRTVLRWISSQQSKKLYEAGLLHGNAVSPKKRRLPQAVFDIIAKTIREMVAISAKLGPKKICIRANERIQEYNLQHSTELPEAKIGIVTYEYNRYDAWIRMARAEGIDKADLEYGCVGKYQRPERILDEVELDHHLVDIHAVLGKTPLGADFSRAGIDRFWVTFAFDGHSGYPIGFYPSFEPGSLMAGLMCVDHAIRPKPYVAERWPDIQGHYLSYGKMVKVRFDNAKAHVKIQMRRALARIGVSFELSIPGRADTKPYVERFNGTFEQDLIHWLLGSTGSNPQDKGGRKPLKEAIITLDDLMELIHQWLIEVYCRRPQLSLDNETPEERWVRGASSPQHRPRLLTPVEEARWDLIPCLELPLLATRNGIRWNNLDYNGPELQKMRREAGYHGHRELHATPVVARIPLYDVGTMHVALPTAAESGEMTPKSEITLRSSNVFAHGRKKWEHDVTCAFLRAAGKNPRNHAHYEEGFCRLFRNAMKKMGIETNGEDAPKSVKLTGGQAPRFLGVLDRGAVRPALEKTEETMQLFGIFSSVDDHFNQTSATNDGAVKPEAAQPDLSSGDFAFAVDDALGDIPE